jgi:hypothetical protein
MTVNIHVTQLTVLIRNNRAPSFNVPKTNSEDSHVSGRARLSAQKKNINMKFLKT